MEVHRVSVAELCRRTELSEDEIRDFLAAKAEPTASELLRLAGGREVPLSQILDGMRWESDGEGGGSIREDRGD